MNHSIDLSYIIDQAWWCRHNGGEENRSKEDLRYKFSASYLWPLKSVLFYNFILTLFFHNSSHKLLLPSISSDYLLYLVNCKYQYFGDWEEDSSLFYGCWSIYFDHSILINRPETFSLINRKFLCNHMQGKRQSLLHLTQKWKFS